MIRLLSELHAGVRSGEEEGWLTETDVRAHFAKRRAAVEAAGETS